MRILSVFIAVCICHWTALRIPAEERSFATESSAQPTSSADATSAPPVTVTNVRRVFHNGEHNAFTDLIHFKDKYYLTFRSCPDGHMVHPTASIIVLASEDLKNWSKVHQFNVRHRDTRDPHFLVFGDQLFVLTGTWYSGEKTIPIKDYDLNFHLGYSVSTENGTEWSQPTMLEGTFGHYIWRAAAHGNTAYLCGRRKHQFDRRSRRDGATVESVMLESVDGLVWKPRAMFQEVQGDETAFLFDADGSVTGIARRGRGNAELLRSRPPYETWTRSDLGRYIGGPLIARWGNRLIAGGRNNTSDGPRTKLAWLVNGKLSEFATLPSGGDNSYPGFIALDDRTAVVSWYSSHEINSSGQHITAIYMADLTIEDSPASTPPAPE